MTADSHLPGHQPSCRRLSHRNTGRAGLSWGEVLLLWDPEVHVVFAFFDGKGRDRGTGDINGPARSQVEGPAVKGAHDARALEGPLR